MMCYQYANNKEYFDTAEPGSKLKKKKSKAWDNLPSDLGNCWSFQSMSFHK